MHVRPVVKCMILGWVVPALILLVVHVAGPDPNQRREEFPGKTFEPVRIWIAENSDGRGADSFELRIASPDGEEYFHRDPEPEPIEELDRRFPRNKEVSIRYAESIEGNVLLEVVVVNGPALEAILPFESVMTEYSHRRRVVYIVAATWCLFFNLLAYVLWK